MGGAAALLSADQLLELQAEYYPHEYFVSS